MRLLLITALALALASSAASASIIDWNCDDDGDGGIEMGNQLMMGTAPDYTLTMQGPQNWLTAHVNGAFTTDSPADPNVWVIESVDNATAITWNKYVVYVGMPQNFSITGVQAPLNWTYSITPVTTGMIPGHVLPGGTPGYMGKVTYTAAPGAEIDPGQSADFGFKMSFLGSVIFSTEQVATPEPASMLLLAVGGLLLRRRR
jgi:MYXO-CTERM domain-containing protein